MFERDFQEYVERNGRGNRRGLPETSVAAARQATRSWLHNFNAWKRRKRALIATCDGPPQLWCCSAITPGYAKPWDEVIGNGVPTVVALPVIAGSKDQALARREQWSAAIDSRGGAHFDPAPVSPMRQFWLPSRVVAAARRIADELSV